MKVQTTNLIGAALDYAVARAENIPAEEIKLPGWKGDNLYRFLRDEEGKLNGSYMTGPGLIFHKGPAGDDIIDREGINTMRGNDLYFPKGNEKGEHYEKLWIAKHNGLMAHGPTRRIAAMRCYVASVLGNEIDLPETLK